MSQALTITQLVSNIKRTLESNPELSQVEVVGEISNLTKSKAGHWYFSLKDDSSKISCVMFYSQTLKISSPINEGDEVLVKGSVSMYTGTGTVQLVLSSMQHNGLGALYKKYIELRDQLHKQGYFNSSHKKGLPKYPMSIGVIVGAQSAAQADILKTLSSRWPIASVVMYESLVQGVLAPTQLIDKLKEADLHHHDVIILARGGGSLEDLWAFNDVELVMSIFEANTPIITGVGHEIDVTLVDYVADARGLTPTDAAIKATPDQHEVIQSFETVSNSLKLLIHKHLSQSQHQLKQVVNQSVLVRPQLMLLNHDVKLREYKEKLNQFHQQFTSVLVNFDKVQQKLNHQSQSLLNNWQSSLTLMNQRINQNMNSLLNQNKLQFKNYHQQIKVSKLLVDLEKNMNKVDNNLERLSLKFKQLLQLNSHKIQLYHEQLELKSPLNLLKKGYVLTYQNSKLVKSIHEINDKQPMTLQYIDGQVEVALKEKK